MDSRKKLWTFSLRQHMYFWACCIAQKWRFAKFASMHKKENKKLTCIERTEGIYFAMVENLPNFATLLPKSSSPQVWPDPKNQVEHQELKVPDSCCKTVGTSLILCYLSFLLSLIIPTLFKRWVKTAGGGTIRAIYITQAASTGELQYQIHCTMELEQWELCN